MKGLVMIQSVVCVGVPPSSVQTQTYQTFKLCGHVLPETNLDPILVLRDFSHIAPSHMLPCWSKKRDHIPYEHELNVKN